MRTQVAIIGAGPAGLVLAHLLARSGVDSVVLECRGRAEIEATIRAGVLEHGTVALLCETGLGDRLLREGVRHDGIELRFGGRGHRIDLRGLTGESVWLYPQHEVLTDLIAARLDAGGDLRFGVEDVELLDVTTDRPRVAFTDGGEPQVLDCDWVVGCDGSSGTSRSAMPASGRSDFYREYPFGWFGILAEAPPSAAELVYAHSERGFALISTRTETVQRMYFQCDPQEKAEDWSDAQIWAELQSRVEGLELRTGPIFDRGVIPMRSYVREPLRHGRLLLAGDAAHTVPPTGAKGLNLAVADIRVLAPALAAFYRDGSNHLVDGYSDTALRRVWRTQHFSYWMTTMLHSSAVASEFDQARQLGELDLVTGSEAGARYLAEAYVGWPDRAFAAP